LNSLYVLPILLFSIVVHEVAHGWMALLLGDTTARDSGRLTLNPIPHIDPIGSIAVPLLSYISVGSVFIAWAKPVPVNPANFHNIRRDEILVSVIGPLSNLALAFLCTMFYIILSHFVGPVNLIDNDLQHTMAVFGVQMFKSGITLNIFLAVFNLIPMPPLDGSHVLSALLPEKLSNQYQQIGFWGILVVIFLMRIAWFQHAIVSIVLLLRMPMDVLIKLYT
jgi:Zn-dependent protease